MGRNLVRSFDGTYVGGAAVTPHDTNELAIYARALYIGGTGSGALKVTTPDGVVVTFAGLTVNTIVPIRAKIVWSTGTDVTAIVALY